MTHYNIRRHILTFTPLDTYRHSHIHHSRFPLTLTLNTQTQDGQLTISISIYHDQHAFPLSSTNDTYHHASYSCHTLTAYFRYTRPPSSSSSLVHSYVIYTHTCLSFYITTWLSTFIIIYIYIYILHRLVCHCIAPSLLCHWSVMRLILK